MVPVSNADPRKLDRINNCPDLGYLSPLTACQLDKKLPNFAFWSVRKSL
jgi:hypothetical protein